jgi:ElaB/YqjD/DUF883 family membrane-anchored ribosome-binding protein
MSTAEANEKLSGDLRAAVSDAEGVLKAAGGIAGESAHEVRSRLAAAIESAKATCQRLEEKSLAAAKATDRVIRDHPYESIGVAFGLGLLIGVLVARNR